MPVDKDVQKAALKEAIDEGLEKKFASFGRWALRSIAALAFATLVYLYLISHGWVQK